MVAWRLGEELWLGLRPFVFGPCTLGRTWGTHPVSDSSDEASENQNVEVCGIPHLAKYERDAPNFLHVALDKTACAPFIKERRMKFAEPIKPSQEIGDGGHPGFIGRDRVWGSLEGWTSGFGRWDRG